MRPITLDACTIELDVSEAPDALLTAGNFIDLLEGFDKTPLWLLQPRLIGIADRDRNLNGRIEHLAPVRPPLCCAARKASASRG